MFLKGISQAEVARTLNVTTAAANYWHTAWKRKGIRGLKSKGKSGFTSELTPEAKKKLKAAILKGARTYGYDTDLWTLPRIAAVMKKVAGVSFGHTWTWQIVLSLGFTCQKPERRSRERDERAIAEWREKIFPRLKKMGTKTWIPTGVSG